MGAKAPQDILGFEYDWLACDGNGHVAMFSTAGGGYAPAEFLADTDAHSVAIDAILALPPTTAVRFAPELPDGYPNTWLLMAERGVFAFDSDTQGRPYRLVAAPENAIDVSSLPQPIGVVIRCLLYPDLRFGDISSVSAESLGRGP